jgi:GntR family transcriptional regulator
MLAKNSPIPLYYQLAERLQEQIRSGELRSGEQLPSERELSEQVGVSRMTARQAVAYLAREGLLEVKPGVGTFVAEPKLAYDALHLLGFTEEMACRGVGVTSRVLEQEIVIPPPRVARELALASGQETVKIARVRLSQNVPLLMETIFIPLALCPDLATQELASQSLYGVLASRYGLSLVRARQTLESTIANEYEAELFGVPPGAPMILLEGVTYSHRDRPVEYFKAIYRGDRCKFELESRRNGALYEQAGAQVINLSLGLR